MRILVTRRIEGSGGSILLVPVCTKPSEEEAMRAIAQDKGAIGQLIRRKVENPNGPDATVQDALAAVGIEGISWSVTVLDQDELIQLAGDAEVRGLAHRGKLVQ